MIEIREIYTGRFPKWSIFGSAKDMLVTSAVKSVSTFDAKPLALNFLERGVSPRSRRQRPRASEGGTPIVFYSPAVVDRSLTLDLSVVFDEFPQHLLDGVSAGFRSAAGLPIFLAHGTYLLAAGEVARVVGEGLEMLLDRRPAFQVSDPVHIEWPGEVQQMSGLALITPHDVDREDPDFRRRYRIERGTLVDEAGNPYNGDIPYLIVSFDGTRDESLAEFVPTAASAALLTRFLGMKEGQSQGIDLLVDALKVYNDVHFRRELDRNDERAADVAKRLGEINAALGQAPQDSDRLRLEAAKKKLADEREQLQRMRDALRQNIATKHLRPA